MNGCSSGKIAKQECVGCGPTANEVKGATLQTQLFHQTLLQKYSLLVSRARHMTVWLIRWSNNAERCVLQLSLVQTPARNGKGRVYAYLKNHAHCG